MGSTVRIEGSTVRIEGYSEDCGSTEPQEGTGRGFTQALRPCGESLQGGTEGLQGGAEGRSTEGL
jgi:hypothetical protein